MGSFTSYSGDISNNETKSRGRVGSIIGRAAVSAIGFESEMNYGKDKDSFAKLKTYSSRTKTRN